MSFGVETFIDLLMRIIDKRVSDEQACVWLEAAIASVEADYQTVCDICQSTAYESASPREVQQGLSALEDYREALGLVEEYYLEEVEEYLGQAAELALQARQKLDVARAENQAVSGSFRCELVL